MAVVVLMLLLSKKIQQILLFVVLLCAPRQQTLLYVVGRERERGERSKWVGGGEENVSSKDGEHEVRKTESSRNGEGR